MAPRIPRHRCFPNEGRLASVLTALLLSLLVGCGREGLVEEGAQFPELALGSLDSPAISTGAFRGKVVVLNLWASWCVPCREEMPALDALSRRLDPARFAVVGVAVDEDPHLAREFLLQRRIGFTSYWDRGGKTVGPPIGSRALPETLVIGRDGRLLARITGPRDWSAEPVVQALARAWEDETLPDSLRRGP